MPRRVWIATALILIFMPLFTRKVAELPLWVDEGWSITASRWDDPATFIEFLEQDAHPPLYFVLLRGWEAAVGSSLPALRFLSVFAAILTLAITFRLAGQWFNTRAAIMALIIVATSDLILSQAASVRHYTLFMLLAALSTWAYWVSGENTPIPSPFPVHRERELSPSSFTGRGWGRGFSTQHSALSTQHFNFYILHSTFYILSALALIYTLYWGVFILIAHGIHALIFRRQQLGRFAIAALIIGVCYLPWLPIIQTQMGGGNATTGGVGYRFGVPVNQEGLAIIFYQLTGAPETLYIGLALAGIVGSFIVGAHRHVPNENRSQGRFTNRPYIAALRPYFPTETTLLAGLWLIMPILIPILVGLAGYDILHYRPLTGMIPALAILAGHTLSQFERWLYYIFIVILLVNNLTQGGGYELREDWWELGDLLAEYAAPGDGLLIEADNIRVYTIEIHADRANMPDHGVIRGRQIRENYVGENADSVSDEMAKYDTIWLVEYEPNYDNRADLAALGFAQTLPDFRFEYDFNGKFLTVSRFQKIPAGDALARFGIDLVLQNYRAYEHENATNINLIWQTRNTAAVDYSVSVFLLAPNGLPAIQHDDYPLEGKSPTTGWQIGTYYFDHHHLETSTLPPGEYPIAVKIYTWWDGVIQTPAPCSDAGCTYTVIGSVQINH